ncbi:hypothetical protein B0H67DRAFT_500719, partial [Lasiosphaeris hirsuta]
AAAVDTITEALMHQLAWSMMLPIEDINAARPLSAYGVDSLVAAEVRNWITMEMVVEVSVFEVVASVPMCDLADKFVKRVGRVG